jgi:hypothetical protein
MEHTLENYKDIHKGRMAFVAGSGPSLRHVEPERLKDYIVIAINGAILKLPDADYFFSCDGRVTLTKAWQILKDVRCKLILNTTLSGFYSFDGILGIKSDEGISQDRICFFKRDFKNQHAIDKRSLLLMGSSSAHPAVHFAHLLGCSPIVLLGMDCGVEDGKRMVSRKMAYTSRNGKNSSVQRGFLSTVHSGIPGQQ